MALIDGVKWGLVLAILVGPILLSLVQAGIERGIRLGMVLGFGVWFSDLLFIMLVYWGISLIPFSPNFYFLVGMIGGVVLIAFGEQFYFFKSTPTHRQGYQSKNI